MILLMELKPGEEFNTPAIIVGYINEGFEKMTHNLHNYAKNNMYERGIKGHFI